MVKGRPFPLAGLDVGTSKTVACIAVAGKTPFPKFLGVGESLTVGVEEGVITDIAAASKSIRKALEQAENEAGIRASLAYACYHGAGVALRKCRVSLPAGGNFSVRSASAMLPDFFEGSVAGVPDGEEILQLIPPRVLLEGLSKTGELGARAVTVRTADIVKLAKSARLAGLNLQEIIYSPVAGAEILLTPSEKELGTLLVEFGASRTTVSILGRGALRETAVLPVGGEHLVGDLAIGLRTTLTKAEKILKDYSRQAGGHGGGFDLEPEPLTKQDVDGPAGLINTIIEARMNEILELVASTVRSFGYPGALPGGAVLYGGVCELKGFTRMAVDRLEMPVRTGSVEAPELTAGPAFVNAFGLLKYAYVSLDKEKVKNKGNKRPYRGFTGKFLNWLQGRLKED